MACFLAPTAAAIVTASIKKKVPPNYHLEWLNTMLWGGVIMLIVDHIINKEIFSPIIWQEVLVIGGSMTLAIICVWMIMVLFANLAIKSRIKKIFNN